MFFRWSLSNSKSPQVSKILLNNLANPNNIVVWIAPIRSLISNSSIPLSKPLVGAF